VPNIASAKKNMRKARAATVRNRAQRAALRTALKKAKTPTATAEERLKAVSLLDRAARRASFTRTPRHVTRAAWPPAPGITRFVGVPTKGPGRFVRAFVISGRSGQSP
jgi:small subunit ribosomal protein S20